VVRSGFKSLAEADRDHVLREIGHVTRFSLVKHVMYTLNAEDIGEASAERGLITRVRYVLKKVCGAQAVPDVAFVSAREPALIHTPAANRRLIHTLIPLLQPHPKPSVLLS
jgi:hypothetical protein